jgi:hypothetical protein
LLSAPLNAPSDNRELRALAPPQAEAVVSIKPLMDISALISANNDWAEVPARVGGHPLTLTAVSQNDHFVRQRVSRAIRTTLKRMPGEVGAVPGVVTTNG